MKKKTNQLIALTMAIVMVVLVMMPESFSYASERITEAIETMSAEETVEGPDENVQKITMIDETQDDSEEILADNKAKDTSSDKQSNVSKKFNKNKIPEYINKKDVVLNGTGGYAYGYRVKPDKDFDEDSVTVSAADDSSVKDGYIDFAPFKVKHQIIADGKEIKDGSTIDPKKDFKLTLAFELNRNNMAANGLDYYYVLPEHISVGNVGSPNAPETLFMTSALTGENIPIGTYYIEDNVVYVSFPGYYDYTYAMIEMSGSWEDYENRAFIPVDWDGTEEKYNLDVCDLSIVKSSTGYVSNPDGSLTVTYKVKVTADTNGGNINDITFNDKFRPGKLVMDKDTYEGDAYRLTIYHEDKTMASQQTYSYDEVTTGNYDITITGIDMEPGGYFTVEYAATVPVEERKKIDSQNGSTSYNNEATASYDITNPDTGEPDTLSVSTDISNNYSSKSEWVYKEAGDASSRKIDGETRTVIPYVVGINKHRYYSLGGSIITDEITNFVGGRVNYDTSGNGTTEVDVTDNTGNKTVQQTWIVLDDLDLYESLQGLASASSNTALEKLRNNNTLVSKIVAAINSATGESYTEFNDEMALKYVFTYEDAQKGCYNFVWFMPMDERPTSYMLRYDTYIINDPDSEVTEFDNNVSMWYTDLEGVPYGPGAGWVKPVKKVMNSTKKNGGVYIGDDGNYYVDYVITVGVEAGSAAFDDVMLKDYVPSHRYTLPSGEDVNLEDWFAGLEETDFVPNVSAEQTFKNFNAIFDISTDSTDPNVQKVVDRSYASIHRTESNWYLDYWKVDYGVKDMDGTNVVQESTMYESTDTFAAGQFLNNTNETVTYSSSRSLDPGETYSPRSFYIYFGPLPATDEGYDIQVKYTMQVNPMLINVLPELLEQEGKDYITQTNKYTVYTTYMKAGTNGKPFEALEEASAGRISQGAVDYWLGIDDDYPGIAKEAGEYDADENTFGYKLTVNPSKDINGENKTYEITDNLNVSGLKYIPDSFKVTDEDGKVVYSSNSSSIDSIYRGLVNLSITNNDRESNNFTFRLDNSSGVFTSTAGKIKQLKITYDVDTSTIETDTDMYNVAQLVKIEKDDATGEEKRVVLGTADLEYAIDKALDKKITEEPSVANAYDATYRIDVNPSSENSDGMENDDEFTVKDILNPTLTILFETAKVYKVKEGVQTEITNTCTLGYNEHTRELTATVPITDKDAIYRIVYKAHVEGEANKLVVTSNEAKVVGKDIKPDKVKEKVVIYQYNTESVAYNMQVKLQKYNRYNIDDNSSLSAEFELYRWVSSDDMQGDLKTELEAAGAQSNSWLKLDTTDNGSIKTGNDGLVIINNNLVTAGAIPLVEKDTFYMLKEVKAPTDFIVDPTPIYYYVSSDGSEPNLATYGIRTYVKSTDDYSLLKLAPIGTTDEDLPILYVGNERLGFTIEKIDEDEKTVLKGAEFTLYKDEACTQVIKKVKDSDDGKEDGTIDFSNIDVPVNATYYLKETKVPDGFVDANGVISLVFEDGQITSATAANNKTFEFTIVNGKSDVTIGNQEKQGKLKIFKEVRFGKRTDEFSFAVIFKDGNGKEITEDIEAIKVDKEGNEESFTYRSGDTFKIKDSEYVVFKGLEEGVTYKVSEIPGAYYRSHYEIEDKTGNDASSEKAGNQATGTIEEENMDTVNFYNSRAYSITVTKHALDERGEELDIPDGLTLLVSHANSLVATGVYNDTKGKFDVTLENSNYSVTTIDNGFKISGVEVFSSSYSNKFTVVERKADKEGYESYVCTYDLYSDGEEIKSGVEYVDNAEHYQYSDNTTKEEIGINLNNTYTNDTVSAKLKAQKKLTDINDNELSLEGKKFTFNLYAGTSINDSAIIDTVDADSEGKVDFKTLSFAKAGTYKYSIKEAIPSGASFYASGIYKLGNIYYTTKALYAKVIVVKEGNELVVDSVNYYDSYRMEDESLIDETEVVFVNKYDAKGDITIKGKKTFVNGPVKTFTIECYKTGSDYVTGDNNLEETTTTSISNDTLGDYSFKFNYDMSDIGTYYYVVREVIPAGAVDYVKDGITYDTTEYRVKVVISDNNDGTLKVEKTVTNTVDNTTKNDTEGLDFTNEYKADGSLEISASKSAITDEDAAYNDEATDGTKKNNKFTVEVYEVVNGTDKLVTSADVEVGDTTTLDKIKYGLDDLGEHHYKIVEKAPGTDAASNGYTYDDKVYDLYVLVEDSGIGNLVLSTKTSSEDRYAKQDDKDITYECEFVNTYSAVGDVTFVGRKVIDHIDKLTSMIDIKEGMFKFDVSEVTASGETNKLFVAESDELLNIKFDKINYSMKDVGKHIYKIEEQKDEQEANILYTAKSVFVVVDVVNNGDGTLKTSVKYYNVDSVDEINDNENTNADAADDSGVDVYEGAEFINELTDTKILKTDEDNKNLEGAKLQVIDANGDMVYEYVSTNDDEVIYGLNRNSVYTLHEVEAPKGYDLAKDVKFKLDDDGKVLVEVNGEFTPSEKVVMVDVKTVIKETETPGQKTTEKVEKRDKKKKKNKKNKKEKTSKVKETETETEIETETDTSIKTDAEDRDRPVETGDTSHIGLMFALMIISMIMVLILRKKREEE